MSDRQTRVNVSIDVRHEQPCHPWRRDRHVIPGDVAKNPKSVWWSTIWGKKTLDQILGKNNKNLVFSRISHLHSKLFLGLKRALICIVVAFLNPSRHRKCHIDKRSFKPLNVRYFLRGGMRLQKSRSITIPKHGSSRNPVSPFTTSAKSLGFFNLIFSNCKSLNFYK